MKRLSILGSTGSIGRNALEIVTMHPDNFDVTVIAAANNVKLLAEQIKIFRPKIAVVLNNERADELKSILNQSNRQDRQSNRQDRQTNRQDRQTNRQDRQTNKEEKQTKNNRCYSHEVEIYWGEKGYALAASYENVDTVLLAMVGSAGLMPALAAIDARKQIALANKETLVMAGELVMARAAEKGVSIYPVDSEHSAIFQCLQGNRTKDIKKIFLTASGGPFRKTPLEHFKDIKPQNALNHPTWNMGSKITIDSATLMNKALEIVEAVRLFNVPVSDIEVLVHPQSIVHSMVGFSDGSVMAQMGIPDMKTAISYALSYPERLDLKIKFPDFTSLDHSKFTSLDHLDFTSLDNSDFTSLDPSQGRSSGHLVFEKPDKKKFPSLDFAVEACRQGGTLPAVMNAANEIAVNAFLNHEIDFPRIFTIIEKTMKMHKNIKTRGEILEGSILEGSGTNTVNYTLDDVISADKWARETSILLIKEG